MTNKGKSSRNILGCVCQGLIFILNVLLFFSSMGCVNFSPPPLHRVIHASSVTQVDLSTQLHLVIHRPPICALLRW